MENSKKCDCACLHESEVVVATSAICKIANMDMLQNFFKTFADNTRLKIICALDSAESMCVCDIAVALNMTKSAISHQLQNLKKVKLIKTRKSGKEIFYSLADNHVKDVFEIGLEHVREMP